MIRKSILLAGIIIAGSAILLIHYINQYSHADSFSRNTPETLTPWRSVGGCGAGGSGGVARDGIKWLGEGVSGGFGKLEVLPRYNFGQDFSMITMAPRLTYKVNWNNIIGISVPVVSKHKDVQIQTNMAPVHHTTGGTGDISLEYTRILGAYGQYNLNMRLTLPTGQYDIKRGRDSEKYFLPKLLQKGTGVYYLTSNLSYTRDVENGFWFADVEFSFPFNMKLFTNENRYMDEYFSNYKQFKNDERFYYTFKPYGENDLGDVTPMNLSFSIAYAYRGIENQVHSIGLLGSVPLGTAYINQVDLVNNQGDYSESVYKKPIKDPDFLRWNSALVYGLELSRETLPVFMAISIPLHADTDEEDPSKWTGPDWNDFGQRMTFALGLKASLF